MKYPPKRIGIQHIDWVGLVLITELPLISKSIVMYLSRFMNKDQYVAWPSQSRIMYELSISKGALNKHLNLLESEGWITRKKGDPTTNTRYWITFPKGIEAEIKKINKGSSPDELGSTQGIRRSSPGELEVVHEVNTNSILNSKTNSNAQKDAFTIFWETYPRKKDKQKAKVAFNRLSKKEQALATKDSSTRFNETEKTYIPYPSKYLNGKRWEDEIEVASQSICDHPNLNPSTFGITQ